MKRTRCIALALIVFTVGFIMVAHAEGPSFDCTKAKGETEELICSDASLATLDSKLAAVYKAATAKATGKLARQLHSEQRGWIKARNECWKARGQQTWITATWTVDTEKKCLDAQYRIRTSELQSIWRLLLPKTVYYTCQNNPANEVVANFFETDPATIRLERGDRTVTMWLVNAAVEGLYEGQNVSLVREGTGIQVNWLNTDTGKTDELQCKAR